MRGLPTCGRAGDPGATITGVPVKYDVPLFPLPGHVLLPGLPTPFHIFEPRYRSLITDLQQLPVAERWLAVPRVLPGFEVAAGGAPPLVTTVTAARLAATTELPDGRYLVAVVGEGRWRLTETPSTRPYRLARLDRLPDVPQNHDFVERVAGAVVSALGARPAVPEDVLALLDTQRHDPGLVLDRLAALTLVDPELRQRFLEANSVGCRLRVLAGSQCGSGEIPARSLN